MYLEKIRAFLSLIRSRNIIIVVISQYMARVFLIGPKNQWLEIIQDTNLFLLVLATSAIAAGGYIINDYFDIKIDIINKPDKVIIGKIIPRRWAILIHQIFSLSGLIIGFYLNFHIGIINFVAVSLLWFYSERFKRKAFIGNFLVATLTAISILVVGIFYRINMEFIVIYAIFAFFISLIREVIKDMEDIRGDSKYNCQTLPIIWGIRKTKILIYILIGFFYSLLLSIAVSINNPYLLLLFSSSILPFIWLSYKVYIADKKRDFTFLSSVCKTIMIIGIGSMLFV